MAGVRLRAWVRGLQHEAPPLAREFVAYLLAYLVCFWALKSLGTPWAYVVIATAFTFALAVTVHGPAPLFTRDYFKTAGFTFAVLAVCLAIGVVLAPLFPD